MTSKNRGFTLVELTLALAFISFLLLFMVAAILQVTRLYVKGSAIRQINQTGRQLVDDVSASLRTGKKLQFQGEYNRLCVDNTSYIWNSEGEVVNKFIGETTTTTLRFVSVKDDGGKLCDTPTTDLIKSESTDLIGPDITPLEFSVKQTGKLWNISLVLATAGSNLPRNVGSDDAPKFECAPDNQFCAFGDFQTSVYARGGN